MPTIKLQGLGEIGIINDLPRFHIEPNAFSAGQNVRIAHRRARNFGGRLLQTTAPIEPYALFPVQTPSRQTLWVQGGLNSVYVYDGVSHTDITRLSGPYTLDEYLSRWTGGIQGTLGFFNPGTEDAPQVWPEIDITERLVDMTYDPTAGAGSRTWADLGYRAYSMRPYKSTIMAMNITRGPVPLAGTVQWCDFIAPGDTEPDWVPRTTNSAGEQPLGDTGGAIIDGDALRDDFIIYKEDSAWRCSFTGDADNPFAFERLPDYVRIINRNCIGVAEEFHVLASRDDVQIFDGNVFRSILEHKLREYYRTLLFPERLFTTFVSVLNSEQEVWICFPVSDQTGVLKFPDRAIVWNYHDNTTSLTDLPEVRDFNEGVIVTPQSDNFDDEVPAPLTFDQDKLRFDDSPFQTNRDFLVGAHGTSVSVFGENPTDNGTPRLCVAERTGLTLPDRGQMSADRVRTIRAVRPYMQTTGPVGIQVGGQLSPGASMKWEPEQQFNPMTDDELRFRATGRLFGYRIRSQSDVNWELTDMEIEYTLRRNR